MTRRERQHDTIREEIKMIARQQMVESGTAGLSLRKIAEKMEMTAPALYRYFPRRDDLITALILDAFNSLADAMQAAAESQPESDYARRLLAVMLGYRQWAVTHSVDFELIYGNPIPGYEAPSELTVPAVQRGFVIVGEILAGAQTAGLLKSEVEQQPLPPTIHQHIQTLIDNDQYPVTPIVIYLSVAGWVRMHGMIMLELFGHLGPTVGDLDAFYRLESMTFLKSIGLSP